MTDALQRHVPRRPGRSDPVRLAGAAGLLGCVALVAGNVAGVLIYEHHDPIRDTISDLAAGPHAWIQDAGLLVFAAGIAAVAAGMARWPRPAPRRWRAAAGLTALMAVDVAVIAAHNEYGDRDSGAFVIHGYAVYVLAGLFALATVLAAGPLGARGRSWRIFAWAVPALWVVLGPPFFFLPTAWDGAYERALALIVVAWFAAVSILLIRRPPQGPGG